MLIVIVSFKVMVNGVLFSNLGQVLKSSLSGVKLILAGKFHTSGSWEGNGSVGGRFYHEFLVALP